MGLSLRLVKIYIKKIKEIHDMEIRTKIKLYGPRIYYALFSIKILLLNVKICFYLMKEQHYIATCPL